MKELDLIRTLKLHKINAAVLTETKKKWRCTVDTDKNARAYRNRAKLSNQENIESLKI